MTTTEIVQKLWNLCNVLRDDGITYHQYVTELTYILFLKGESYYRQSLKVALGPDNFPVFYFDYFQMYRESIRNIQTVNLGWLKVEKPLRVAANP